MATIPPPLTSLPIETEKSGFYRGLNFNIAHGSKLLVAFFLIWAASNPTAAGEFLGAIKTWSLANFTYYYMYVVFFYIVVCIGLAVWPTSGRVILGKAGEKPEFSRFSWFSMMFGAGIGIGMLTYATGEPISHFPEQPRCHPGCRTLWQDC